MLPFQPLIQKLTRLEKTGINNLAKQVVVSQENTVVDYNTDEQLFKKGVGVDNKKLKPKYKRRTISIKKRKSQPSDRVTLKDTGAFHSSFYIDAKKEFFIIRANDAKTGKLVKKYSDKIFGLTAPSKARLSKDLKRKLLMKIHKRL